MQRALLATIAFVALVDGAAAECVHDVASLRRIAGDPAFPVRWIETGMDDGKPLSLALDDRDGALHLRFDKAREGLWAEGLASICAVGAKLEMRFAPGQMQAGPAASWVVRQVLAAGGRFTFTRTAAGELRVSSTAWTGRFSEATPR